MTADQVKGKGFSGALNYNLEKVAKGVAEMLDTNFSQRSVSGIMREVQMIKSLRPNLKKYFYHTSLNFPPNEDLPNEKMLQIANDYLQENGFTQHQYAIFRHYDADHPHLHILVNRIGFDGTVLSDSQDYARSEKVLRRLEKKYGLKTVVSSRQVQERAMTKNELEMMKRTDEVSVKMKLQVMLKGILKEGMTTSQFIQALEDRGINVLFNQASTGFVSGISYGYEGMIFKGAVLGNAYKWTGVKNIINYEQERDSAAICKANLRTKSRSAAGGLGQGNYYGEGNSKMASKQRVPIQGGASGADREGGIALSGVDNKGGIRVLSPAGHGAANKGNAQSGRKRPEKTGKAAVLVGNTIRGLFGSDNNNPDDDMPILNPYGKKKKKKRPNLGSG